MSDGSNLSSLVAELLRKDFPPNMDVGGSLGLEVESCNWWGSSQLNPRNQLVLWRVAVECVSVVKVYLNPFLNTVP